MVYTGVRLDGWCMSGLGWEGDDGGCCATMRERYEGVESPCAFVGIYIYYICFTRRFLFGSYAIRTVLPRSGGLSSGEGWDAVR